MWRKRKDSLQTPTPSPPPQAQQVSMQTTQSFIHGNMQFSADHPILQNMEKVDSKSFVSAGEELKAFKKLSTWLNEHPNSVQYLYFRVASQQIDDNFNSFKQYALKSQIMEGIHLIQKMETTSKELEVSTQKKMKQFPYPQIQDLKECQNLWQQILQNNVKTGLIKAEINTIIKEEIAKNKLVVANLISLLSSIDAIPMNYIPIADFSALDESNSAITQRIPLCTKLTHKIIEYEGQTSFNFAQLQDISNKYTDIQPDDTEHSPSTIFKNMVHSYDSSLSDENLDSFYDFVFHPNNAVYETAEKFLQTKDKDDYWNLVHTLFDTYDADQNDKKIVAALCSCSIAPIALPELKFDGPCKGTDEEQWNAIKLLATTDPVACLEFINSTGLNQISESLQNITSNWKDVFSYIFDFTDDDTIPNEYVSTRSAIKDLVSQ